jgi:hypothetical protein
MNEVEMLALGDAWPGRRRWYARKNASHSATTSSGSCEARGRSQHCSAAGPASTVPVTAHSRVVLYRRQGPALDVPARGVVRRICLELTGRDGA